MNRVYEGIDVLTCVQGNTVRVRYAAEEYTPDRSSGCVVYDFNRRAASGTVSSGTTPVHKLSDRRDNRKVQANASANRNRRMQQKRRKAARAAELRRKAFQAVILAAVMVLVLGIGGIASKAQSRKVPEAYKYYDTITVAYQENLLDIVLRYDDRDHYKTQFDYVEELCRINNLEFDGSSYPEVTPGTHLVVPYFSAELK